MKVKVSEASGPVLDWMVAKALGYTTSDLDLLYDFKSHDKFQPSAEWAQGGPIIEQEEYCAPTRHYGCGEENPDKWQAGFGIYPWMRGPTPLIAAMRCYVASKLGEEVEVPGELV